jgi:hypothetical protein
MRHSGKQMNHQGRRVIVPIKLLVPPFELLWLPTAAGLREGKLKLLSNGLGPLPFAHVSNATGSA